MRLPIKALIDMCSRPYDAEKENLFPCKEGDFILLGHVHRFEKLPHKHQTESHLTVLMHLKAYQRSIF
ncbi:MAG: hypothetical protein KAH08_07140 [Methylococcales bacterium]|nr:hypothetical protein [Methylococcales bacterium]